jgi:hypothetical protein
MGAKLSQTCHKIVEKSSKIVASGAPLSIRRKHTSCTIPFGSPDARIFARALHTGSRWAVSIQARDSGSGWHKRDHPGWHAPSGDGDVIEGVLKFSLRMLAKTLNTASPSAIFSTTAVPVFGPWPP